MSGAGELPAGGLTAPAGAGEVFTQHARLGADEIRAFALSVHDHNPLHHDEMAARAAGYPGVIASGTQIGSFMMAMTASHFSKPAQGGRPRGGLGIAFDIRFRAVVLADEDVEMRWVVATVERNDRLDGWIVKVEGEATSARGLLLSATGTLLIRWVLPA